MQVETVGRVLFRDTDAGGVMYFGNYCSLLEQGYTTWFRQAFRPLSEIFQVYRIYFLVYTLNARYLTPLHYDELFTIQTRLVKIQKIKLLFEIDVRNQANATALSAQVEKVCYCSLKKSIIAIPSEILDPLNMTLCSKE